MKFYLARHGETLENKTGITQGQTPGRLSKLGWQQSKALAKRLAKEPIDAIYCSDLRRCTQSIEPLLRIKKIPVIYTKHLRERTFGIFDGTPSRKFKEYRDSNAAWKKQKPWRARTPGGESWHDVEVRATRILGDIMRREKGKNVLIMTHGGLKTTLMLRFCKKRSSDFGKYLPKNTALSIVEIKGDTTKVRLINCTKHCA